MSTTRHKRTVWLPRAASWATPASAASAWAAGSVGSCASTGSPSTISCRPRSSPPTARSWKHRPAITPILFLGPARRRRELRHRQLVPASRCTPSAPPSWPDRCSGRPRTPPTSCASTASSSPTHLTSSGTSSGSARSRRCRLSTRTSTSGRQSPWPAATPDPSKTASVPSVRSAEFGTPLVDLVGATLYVDHQSGLDDTVPHGWHYYWKATNLTCLSDEVIDIVAAHAYRATSPRSYAAMFHMGGAVAQAPQRCHGVSRSRRGPQHRHRRGVAP